MISSLVEQQLSAFAAKMGNDAVASCIEAYVEHSHYPGPVVSIVGASKRGRSSLFSLMSGTEAPDEGNGICAAVGPAWTGIIWRALSTGRGVEHRQVDLPAGLMIVDCPALDVPSASESIDRAVAMSDLIIMAVQTTQPAGLEEVRFATERIQGRPAVLVITKADLVDDEELLEAIGTVMRAYADVLWQAVLVAGSDVPKEGRCGLQSFTEWWAEQGITCALESRNVVVQVLRDRWVEQARTEIASRLEPLRTEIGQIHSKLAASSDMKRATQLRESIRNRLSGIVARATDMYRQQTPHLDADLDRWIEQSLPQISPERALDRERMQESLRDLFAEWEKNSRSYVRQQIAPTVDALRRECSAFIALVDKLCAEFVGARQRTASIAPGRDDANVLPEIILPELALTEQQLMRSKLLPVMTGSGTTLVLHTATAAILGVAAWPVALLGGVVWWWSNSGTMRENDRRMLKNDFQQAVQRQARVIRHDLQERLREDWQDFVRQIEAELSTYDRRLNILDRASEAPNSDSRERYQRLADEQRGLEALRDELEKLALSGRKELQSVE